MTKFAEAWNEGLVTFGMYGIFLLVVVILGFCIYRKIKERTGNKFLAGIIVAVFAILSYTAYPTSNQKNPDRKEPIAFLQTDPEVKYLIDNGSWVSNDVVHLEFSTRLLPPSAMLYLDYIPKTEPQDSLNYSTYLYGSVDTIPNVVEFMFEGAISNRWVFYTTYTPGPNVHTNGVAVAEFIRAKKYDNVAVPKRSTIWENGVRIWPNSEKYDLFNQLREEIDDDEMD